MSESYPTQELSDSEFACLSYLFRYPEAELIQFESIVVERLERQGFVDKILLMAFPIMIPYVRYRLTDKGRSVIHNTLDDEYTD